MSTKKLTNWRIKGVNGVVLGIFPAMSQLEAWQKCVKELRKGKIVYGKTGQIREKPEAEIPVTALEPGLIFDIVEAREWKPTHTIHANGSNRVDVVAEPTESPKLLNLFTREEWLTHSMNRWTLVDGKGLCINGKEQSYATIEVIKT